jgi:multidrug resistance protein MdtO
LRPAPGRLAFTFRIALICAVTAGVVAAYGTPDAALTIYLVFFLNRGDRTSSIVMSIAMLLMMTLIIAFSLLAAIAVVNSPVMRVAAIALISFGLLFLTSASRLRPVGATMALIVGYALDLLGTVAFGEEATRALLYVWLFVAFPAAVSILVNLLIGPAPRGLLQRSLAARLTLAADQLAAPADGKKMEALRRALRAGDADLSGYLRMTGLERTAPRPALAALGQSIRSSTALLHFVELSERDERLAIAPATAGRLAQTMRGMAAIYAAGSYPLEIEPATGPAESGLLAREIDRALVGFAVADGADAPLPPAHHGFFEPDAFTNKEHVLFALRTTCAALFCYILYSLLDWPGIHTCFLTCYIVSLGTAAESVEKLALRIVGCLAGAIAGYAALLLLVPSITSVGGLMLLVLAGTAAGAWIVAGGPFVAYGGFQFAFAFLLCVIQGDAPAFDLTVARDRIIGILIGNVVAYVALTRLWPTSVAARIDAAISGLLRLLAQPARAPSVAAAAMGAVGTGFAAIARDIELTAYEPDSFGRSANWRSARWRLAGAAEQVAAPLLFATRIGEKRLDSIARELDDLADILSGGKMSTTVKAGTALPALDEAMARLRAETIDGLRAAGGGHAVA